MLYTNGPWIEETDNDTASHMRFVESDANFEAGCWAEFTAALPVLNKIIEENGLTTLANISYGGNLLSISFHARGVNLPSGIETIENEIDSQLGIEIRPVN